MGTLMTLLAIVVAGLSMFGMYWTMRRQNERYEREERQRKIDRAKAQRELKASREIQDAEKDGRFDTVRAWIGWAGQFNAPLPNTHRADIENMFMDGATLGEIEKLDILVDKRMPHDATVDECRTHLRALYAVLPTASKQGRVEDHNTAARATAARVYLLTGGDGFDFAAGMTGYKWMTHDDPNVTAAYLEGAVAAKDEIKTWVIRERDALRRFEKNLHAAAEIARGNNADLAALRETNGIDPTIVEKWDAQFTALDEQTAQAAIDRLS